MDLKNTLEIILVTYNRVEYLQDTFNQIFDEKSPIKNLQITILNNKSTDGTTELIEEYRQKFPNIKHIIHNRNIGGNANIARAFETASMKYFWILCDDDEYNWENWNEIEEAIQNNHDAIVVANYVNPEKNIAQLIKQLTFVPAAIYKTENLNDTVMVNIEFSLSNMFGQLAIGCHLINENKSIHICKNWFVNMIIHGGEETYSRGLDGDIHPYMKNIFWQVGFLNSIQMIKDEELRKFIIQNSSLTENNLYLTFKQFFHTNERHAGGSVKNISDYFSALMKKQKLCFVLCLIWYLLLTKICDPFLRFLEENHIFAVKILHDRVRIVIFNKLKTTIRFAPKQSAINQEAV